jgi:hypothetical protein
VAATAADGATARPDTAYRLIDADEHYYEPDDCFSRHIESRYAGATIRVDRGKDDGLGRIYLGGRRTFMSVMPGDYASAPGALQGLFVGGVNDGFTHREVVSVNDHPEFADKKARLALMDAQGVEAAIMLPTLGVAVEYDMRGDTGLLYASLRAFNRWLEEDWGYGDDGRVFAVPMLSLVDLDQAMTELRRVIDAGARLVHLAPGPVAAGPGSAGGRSPPTRRSTRSGTPSRRPGSPWCSTCRTAATTTSTGRCGRRNRTRRRICSLRCSGLCATPNGPSSTRSSR